MVIKKVFSIINILVKTVHKE